MAAMQKTFPCLTCKQEIKLERKADNSGWNKYNLDGTEHKHESKKQQYQHQQEQKIEELTSEISELKDEVKNLVAAVQFLRMEFAKEMKQKK
jgi:hypothetical protein